MASEPVWLRDLHQVNRARARRWIAEVGEARFMQIAAAANAQKRPSHRPPASYAPLVKKVTFAWLLDATLDLDTAAAKIAAETSASGDWLGCAPVTEAALRRRLRSEWRKLGSPNPSASAYEEHAIDGGDLPFGYVLDLYKEARQSGLPTRLDAFASKIAGTLDALASRSSVTLGSDTPHRSPRPEDFALDGPAYSPSPRTSAAAARLTNLIVPPSSAEAAAKRLIDKLAPVVAIADALEGRIDPKVRVSALAAAIEDLVETLNSEAHSAPE